MMSWFVVPNTGKEWTDNALNDVVASMTELLLWSFFMWIVGVAMPGPDYQTSQNHKPQPGKPGFQLWKLYLTKILEGLHVGMCNTLFSEPKSYQV